MEENLSEKLDAIFKNVNDWLKFAEQKNAALLILNGGLVWGVTRILSNIQQVSDLAYWLNLAGYTLTVISVLLCIISFLPVLKERWFKPEDKKATDNCVFFADIAKYSAGDYIKFLVKKLEIESEKYTAFELDMSSQIVTNAEIAFDKYQRFKLSSALTILAVASFSLSVGLCYFVE